MQEFLGCLDIISTGVTEKVRGMDASVHSTICKIWKPKDALVLPMEVDRLVLLRWAIAALGLTGWFLISGIIIGICGIAVDT
ncbi:hypothetical protein AKJ16_DCAP13722 [Drosera capensis]